MRRQLKAIHRFPIKSHGYEAIQSTELTAGDTMPHDRVWAVAHEQSQADGSEWVPCQNFSRGAKAPGLSAIRIKSDPDHNVVTLSHPDCSDLTFNPDVEGDRLINWSAHLIPDNRAKSMRVVRSRTQGFTDTDFASISLGNLQSHKAVEQAVGKEISTYRWRCNLWFDGAMAWEEFDWVDRDIRIGGAVLRFQERTDRCLATHNNPETGERDLDILSALDSFGHRDFSIRTTVVQSGRIDVGDSVELI